MQIYSWRLIAWSIVLDIQLGAQSRRFVLPIQKERLFSHFLETATGTPQHLLLIIYGQIFILFIFQSKCVLQLLCFLLFS